MRSSQKIESSRDAAPDTLPPTQSQPNEITLYHFILFFNIFLGHTFVNHVCNSAIVSHTLDDDEKNTGLVEIKVVNSFCKQTSCSEC